MGQLDVTVSPGELDLNKLATRCRCVVNGPALGQKGKAISIRSHRISNATHKMAVWRKLPLWDKPLQAVHDFEKAVEQVGQLADESLSHANSPFAIWSIAFR